MDVDSTAVFPRTKIGRDHQMRDAFRHGKVIDRKMDEKRGPLVRVQFLDKQELISYWLPVKQFGSRLTSHYYCPKIGDDVNCNMLANGSESGFVDGSFFNAGNPPPEGVDIDTRHFETEDKSIIEYRELDSTFLLNVQESMHGGVVDVRGVLIKVDATTKITMTAPIIELIASTMIILTAPVIKINGFIDHTGNMNTTGVHTDANGIHGSMTRDAEIDAMKTKIQQLEARLNALEATHH